VSEGSVQILAVSAKLETAVTELTCLIIRIARSTSRCESVI
jgi:hypothetical protein